MSTLTEVSDGSLVTPQPRVQRDRWFYSGAAALLVFFLTTGFWHFYRAGIGFDGNKVPSAVLGFVLVHGLSLTLWVVLFFVQSLLIGTNNKRLHMKLGWGAAVVGGVVAVSGPVVAVVSVRFRGEMPIFGMTYSQFLLPMFAEMFAFACFVLLGLSFRKKNLEAHRAMMMLATLAVISGAIVRTEFVARYLGENSWWGLYGGPFILGGAFLLVRSLLIRRLDRPLAIGFSALVVFFVTGAYAAVTPAWGRIAAASLGC
ncbi:MAG: hypothetical protein JSR48_08125 [Verrucomicrobia bacterium]|nr:hypothetical protein [Verrucomicrobiota bacterium]